MLARGARRCWKNQMEDLGPGRTVAVDVVPRPQGVSRPRGVSAVRRPRSEAASLCRTCLGSERPV